MKIEFDFSSLSEQCLLNVPFSGGLCGIMAVCAAGGGVDWCSLTCLEFGFEVVSAWEDWKCIKAMGFRLNTVSTFCLQISIPSNTCR